MIKHCACGEPIGPLFVGRGQPDQCVECRKLGKQLAQAAEPHLWRVQAKLLMRLGERSIIVVPAHDDRSRVVSSSVVPDDVSEGERFYLRCSLIDDPFIVEALADDLVGKPVKDTEGNVIGEVVSAEVEPEPTWCILRHWQENGRSARVEIMAEGLSREEMQSYWADRPQRGPDWAETYYRTS